MQELAAAAVALRAYTDEQALAATRATNVTALQVTNIIKMLYLNLHCSHPFRKLIPGAGDEARGFFFSTGDEARRPVRRG